MKKYMLGIEWVYDGGEKTIRSGLFGPYNLDVIINWLGKNNFEKFGTVVGDNDTGLVWTRSAENFHPEMQWNIAEEILATVLPINEMDVVNIL